MTDSIRNQLLGLGFKPAPKPERKPERTPERKPQAQQKPRHAERGRNDRAAHGRVDPGRKPADAHGAMPGRKPAGAQHPSRDRGEMDLAKAYAIRAQREKEERIEAERQKQAQARERREAKQKLSELLQGKALNDPAADIARHFDYGGKIKRIHVTALQLKALNAGELGVLQLDGRYLLVDAALLAQAEAVFAPAVALRVDPSVTVAADPYADPRFQVPDDLVW